MNLLFLAVYAIPILWLIKRDTATRDGISPALWIPTLWVGIISSRAVSSWLGFGAGESTIGGSPVDALFFFSMIACSLVVLNRRGVYWGKIISKNWPLFVFYLFLLVSVAWANSPFSSLKRWIKEFGNIAVALVILTEVNPMQALRAVFIRCAYFLIPLSIIYIRYFPNLGRRYSRSGGLEITGVTMQKNSLGVMIMVCGLIFLWDWLERTRPGFSQPRLTRYVTLSIAAMGAYLMYLSQSQTSLLCFVLGSSIIIATRFPLLRNRISAFGFYALIGGGLFFALDQAFGVSAIVVESMNRDMTFTGRTDVWRELLNLPISRVYGTGFMSLWDDMYYRSRLPNWVAFSAHNGYIEVLLAGGYLGITALSVMIVGTGAQINRALAVEGSYAVVRFAIFVAMLVGNFTESNFACMTPVGFLFVVAALGHADTRLTEYEIPRSTSVSRFQRPKTTDATVSWP